VAPLTLHSVANIGPVQQILWKNAGFTQSLLKLESSGALNDHVARYDPTVIPIHKSPSPAEALTTHSTSSTFHCSADYIAAYKSGATTPTQVAERFLEALEKDNRCLIFISTAPREVLLAAAKESTERYAAGVPLPLDGVPLVVKDEFDVAGTAKTLGLSTHEANLRKIGVAEQGKTSWCVQKLLDAGMLFLGKSNMHEIGLDTTNNNPNWGTPPNPYNPGFYPGGSSGGSGAAVGGGLVPIAVGADGGGSIRVPATYCGVYGLKPSHGRVSSAPTISLAPSVGVAGPIAATMADLELSYRIMATPDPLSNFPSPVPTPSTDKKVIGIYRSWFDDCDPEVLKHTQSAISQFRQLGYEIIDISLPYLSESRSAHALTILSEIGNIFCAGNTRGLTPANKVLVAVGSRAPARDFILAQKLRALMMNHLSSTFQDHPGLIIVTPTIPHVGIAIEKGVAEKGGAGTSDANKSLKSMQYVFLANWTGCPAISLPVGYCTETGMPVGLMGMAEWGAEDLLLGWGKEWESVWDGEVGSSGDEGKRKRGSGWIDLLTST